MQGVIYLLFINNDLVPIEIYTMLYCKGIFSNFIENYSKNKS